MLPLYASVIRIDAHDSGNAEIPRRAPGSLNPNLVSENSWMEVVVSYKGVGLLEPPAILAGRPTPGGDLAGFFLAAAFLVFRGLGAALRLAAGVAAGMPQTTVARSGRR